MAKKTSTKKTQPESNVIAIFLKPEVVGLSLMGLGVLTAFSLFSINLGTFTEAWIDFLARTVNWGRYVIWMFLISLGWWFILRYGAENDDEKWEKPIGALLLFATLLVTFDLIAPGGDPIATDTIGGGGVVGWMLSNVLVSAMGYLGSWVILIFLYILTIVLISGLSLRELFSIARDLYYRYQDWRQCRSLPINRPEHASPLLPALPKPKTSFLDRFKLKPEKDDEPLIIGDLVPPTEGIGGSGQPLATQSPAPAAGPLSANIALNPQNDLMANQAESGAQAYLAQEQDRSSGWHLPIIHEILDEKSEMEISQVEIRQRVKTIEETLTSFGVEAKVREINPGPTVTQFSIEPGYMATKDAKGNPRRVRVSKIVSLTNDLALALSAAPIRIEAPIPGRPYVGLEVPNMSKTTVTLRSAMESPLFFQNKGILRIALGRNTAGQPVVVDLTTMPHLLVAGATGAGKSVCVNAIIGCLLCTHTPTEVRFLMIDPKMVELIAYNGIPHLLAPVVTELERVVGVLSWATREMDRRYKAFSKIGARNIASYNKKAEERGEDKLPYIVIIIDELADLMMMAPDEVERTIQRIAQMARATGMHLIIATQRPSVDVVTGLIKANFPARIAFAVTSQIDSRVILDSPGAERLLGKGDMLYLAPDSAKLQRLQGVWLSETEIDRVIKFWGGGVNVRRTLSVQGPVLDPGPLEQQNFLKDLTLSQDDDDEDTPLLTKAIEVVKKQERASVSLLQRRLRIGYSRAAYLIDEMEQQGIIGPAQSGGKAREVLVQAEEVETALPEEDEKVETDEEADRA